MGLRRASARLLVVALVASCAVGVTWTRSSVTAARADVVGAPSWWAGDCDTTYWTSKARSLGWTGVAAHRLGASYLGVPACGPRPSVDGSPNVLWRRAGWGEYEWQCVELAQRFMAQIYGVKAYGANGNQVVSNYSTSYGGGLVKVSNGTTGKPPLPGDVISFNSSTNSNGHVAVVTAANVDGSGNGTVTTMEQNYSANGWRTLTVSGWRVQPSGNLTPYGWLHDPQGRGNPASLLPTSMNLLTNASFELGAAGGWVAGTSPTGQTRTSVTGTPDAPAREGTKLLRLTSTAVGASTWQLVTAAPAIGRSFTFSAWVRSGGAGEATGRLVLTALGGTAEAGQTTFTVGHDWQLVSAPVSITQAGHTALRAEIVAGSTTSPIDVDGTQLVDAGLTNASFETSSPGWSRTSTAVTATITNDPASALEGRGFLAVTTSAAGTGASQTVLAIPQQGHTYTFSAWLRAPGPGTVTGILRTIAAGGTAESSSQPFTVGPEWTLVSAPLSVTRTGHTAFAVQVLANTTGVRVDVDSTQLVDSRLTDGSLELGTGAAWAPYGYGNTLTHVVVTSPALAREGSRFLYLSATQSMASVRQIAGVAPVAGRTYTFSAWVRSAPGSPAVSGRLLVQALGGTVETGSTSFTVGPKWTHVAAPLSVTAAGHTGLAVLVAITSTTTPMYIDATSLVAGDARDADVTPPSLTLAGRPAAKSRTTTAAFRFVSADVDDAAAALTYTCVLDAKTVGCGAAPTWTVGQGNHTLSVVARDPVGNTSPQVTYSWAVDSIAPTAASTAPTSLFTLDPSTTFRWSGSDVGSGLASYDVRVRGADYYSSAWGAWVQPAAWTGTTATSAVYNLAPGRTYCYEVRSHDAFGNVSPWTADRCVSRILDDPALVHGSGWVQMASRGFYLNTVSGTSTAGAVLTKPYAQTDRLALLVTKCPTCGSLGVYVGTTQVATVNLYSATTTRQVLIVLPKFSFRTGTVVLKALTPGKVVQIDGLGISRV